MIINSKSERSVHKYVVQLARTTGGVRVSCRRYWVGGSTNVSEGDVDFDDEYFPDYSGIGRRVFFC